MIHHMCHLISTSGSQRENITAEKSLCISHDMDFELPNFKAISKSFKDCNKVFSLETKNQVEKNGLIKDVINVKFGKRTLSWALYTRNVLKVMRQQVM